MGLTFYTRTNTHVCTSTVLRRTVFLFFIGTVNFIELTDLGLMTTLIWRIPFALKQYETMKNVLTFVARIQVDI